MPLRPSYLIFVTACCALGPAAALEAGPDTAPAPASARVGAPTGGPNGSPTGSTPGSASPASLRLGPANAKPAAEGFAGYDFGVVLQRLQGSVNPLQREVEGSFTAFVREVQGAQALLEEGQTRQGVEKCSAAIDAVVQSRDRVLKPMWEGQRYLHEQIDQVRARLSKAVAAGDRQGAGKLRPEVEASLDQLAQRVADESDPQRRQRLASHYQAVRSLARIRQMAEQLSPDQRKLWLNVLRVLQEANLAHQQVLITSELLFAQFEASAQNLREYLHLMDTVEGATRLLQAVRGVEQAGDGLAGFAQSMAEVQQSLSGFGQAVDAALQGSMAELEAQAHAAEAEARARTPDAAPGPSLDDELQQRIRRLRSP